MYFDHIYPLPQLLPTAPGSGAFSVVWSTAHWGFHHEGKLALISSYSMPTAPSWGRAFKAHLAILHAGVSSCWSLHRPCVSCHRHCEFRCTLPFRCAENPFGLKLATISGSCTLCHFLGRSWILGGRDVRQTSSYRGPNIPQSLMLERGLRGSGWGASFSWDVAS